MRQIKVEYCKICNKLLISEDMHKNGVLFRHIELQELEYVLYENEHVFSKHVREIAIGIACM